MKSKYRKLLITLLTITFVISVFPFSTFAENKTIDTFDSFGGRYVNPATATMSLNHARIPSIPIHLILHFLT